MALIRRLFVALSIAAALVAVAAAPALAKVPYFSVAVTPSDPQAGEPIGVTVRLWNDAAHTVPADWAPPDRAMDAMLVFRSASGDIPVDLTADDDGVWRATLTLPTGSWTLVPFPGWDLPESAPGYAGPLAVTVAAPAAWLASVPMGLGVGALLTIGIIALLARLRGQWRAPAPAHRNEALWDQAR